MSLLITLCITSECEVIELDSLSTTLDNNYYSYVQAAQYAPAAVPQTLGLHLSGRSTNHTRTPRDQAELVS
jgi:hypothetical protein